LSEVASTRPIAPGVRPFAAVSLAYFAFAGLFGTYAPLWFQSLGYTTLAIGTLTSLQSATRVFAPYAWGWWADHSGRRERLLRLAVGGALLASLGFFVAASYEWIAVVCVALFICTAGVIPISEAALAHRVTVEGRVDIGRYGRVRLWGSLGFIAAVTASGFVLQAKGVGWFPRLCSALLAGLLVAVFFLPSNREAGPAGTSPPGALAVLRQPVVAWFFAGVFLTVLAHSALYAFYSLDLASLGYGKGAIGLLWAVGVLAEVAWFLYQGRWVHRLSTHAWLALAALAAALRFALIAAFAGQVAILVVAQLLHALSFAAQHSACIAVIARHFPGRLRSRGQALYTILGYGVSGVVGGVAGGALSESLGFAAVFWAASAVSVAAALACWRAGALERR
jgi:MFS transporter, PPP family, 3-phenylpropionic acid transporter